jgi:hypothetical protein
LLNRRCRDVDADITEGADPAQPFVVVMSGRCPD